MTSSLGDWGIAAPSDLDRNPIKPGSVARQACREQIQGRVWGAVTRRKCWALSG